MKCFTVAVILYMGAVICEANPQRRGDTEPENDVGLGVIPLQPKADALPKAPYPPSGWKPSGERLRLPLPRIEYAAKARAPYVYGPPITAVEKEEATTLAAEEDATTTEAGEQSEQSTSTEAVTEIVTADAETAEATTPPSKLETLDRLRRPSSVETFPVSLGKLNQQGTYYVLLPDARLQRIFYSAAPNPRRQRYSSRLRSVGNQGIYGPLVLYTVQ